MRRQTVEDVTRRCRIVGDGCWVSRTVAPLASGSAGVRGGGAVTDCYGASGYGDGVGLGHGTGDSMGRGDGLGLGHGAGFGDGGSCGYGRDDGSGDDGYGFGSYDDRGD
jgi:hypothetical protein